MNVHFFIWCLFLSVVMATPAFAYLDPGTGSMILQALAAVFITCLVFFQNFRHRIKAFFTRGKKNIARPAQDLTDQTNVDLGAANKEDNSNNRQDMDAKG